MRLSYKVQFVVHGLIIFALMAALCLAPELTQAATTAHGVVASPGPVGHPSSSRHRPANQHLHVAPEVKKNSMQRRKPPVAGGVTHRAYYPRHVYAYHMVGTIAGIVTGPNGGGISGASVRLAKPGGRRIKNPHARHTTSTNSSGTFSMHMVRAGSYRVVASRSGAGKGHTPVAIHTGGIHRVDIKLGGAKPKKPKRHK